MREHFATQLQSTSPLGWRRAHQRLYEHLRSTAPRFPDTLTDMNALYKAVSHACEAGLHRDALDAVYWPRIIRGVEGDDTYSSASFYSTSQLRAYGAEFATLRRFFSDPWHEPIAELGDEGQAFATKQAGYVLRALGRLTEAAECMETALGLHRNLQQWLQATTAAGILSHLYMYTGQLKKALCQAQDTVALADQIEGDEGMFHQKNQRAMLSEVLHNLGDLSQAETELTKADDEFPQPTESRDFAVYNAYFIFDRCDVLLSRGEYEGALEKTRGALSLLRSGHHKGLALALTHLTLGRAIVLREHDTQRGCLAEAVDHLNHAVDHLREAGREDELPRGLSARAEAQRAQGDLGSARSAVQEALSVARRNRMRLQT